MEVKPKSMGTKEKKQNENNDCGLCIFQKLIPFNNDSYNFTAILKTVSNF